MRYTCKIMGKISYLFLKKANGLWKVSEINKNNRREKVYDYIKKFIEKKGYSPSVREIGTGVGLKSNNTVYFHLEKLIEAGLLEKDPFESRTLRLRRKEAVPFVMAPILGKVTAGFPFCR